MTKYPFSLKLICYYSHEKSDCCQGELLVSAVWEDPAEKPVVIFGCHCQGIVLMEVGWP